jgi:phosphatidylglycerophosphate synthase
MNPNWCQIIICILDWCNIHGIFMASIWIASFVETNMATWHCILCLHYAQFSGALELMTRRSKHMDTMDERGTHFTRLLMIFIYIYMFMSFHDSQWCIISYYFTSIDLGMLQFITMSIEVTYFPRFSYFALSEPGSPGNGWREVWDEWWWLGVPSGKQILVA